MKNWYILLALELIGLVGCSSSPVKKVDAEVDSVKGSSNSGVIAMKDGQAIIQDQTNAGDELRQQQFKNYDLENQVNDQYYWLKRCREELADSRLGGNGQVTPIPEIDEMKTPDTIKEEFGINSSNGNLVFVKRQEFLQKMNNERKYETALSKMIKTLKPLREKCEREEGAARLKAGLPANRYQGMSTINSEGNISQVIRKHENNLDDAFDILKSEKQKKE